MNAMRSALWVTGTPARAVLIGAIKVYRATLSGLLGGQCRFYPSCSAYAEDAIRSRGAIVGTGMATWRIVRCNPFGKGGVEPAPAPRHGGAAYLPDRTYEDITHSHRRGVSA